eukprot:1321751-Amorphochlora_amoeboformis.AAC.1
MWNVDKRLAMSRCRCGMSTNALRCGMSSNGLRCGMWNVECGMPTNGLPAGLSTDSNHPRNVNWIVNRR